MPPAALFPLITMVKASPSSIHTHSSFYSAIEKDGSYILLLWQLQLLDSIFFENIIHTIGLLFSLSLLLTFMLFPVGNVGGMVPAMASVL